jgi:glycosyltransferase involved in cell wall biosynthesis
MRILFWNGSFLPRIGGAEIFTARLAQGLVARGHQVAVAANDEGGGEAEGLPGVAVSRFRFHDALRPTATDARARLQLVGDIGSAAAKLKRSFRPDVVHVNLSDTSAFFHLRSLRAYPAATVVTFQAALGQPATDPKGVTGALIAQAHRLVAVSRAAAANVAAFTALPADRIEIIHPGVPAGDFSPGIAECSPARPPVIGFLGRLVEEKGVQVVLEALALLDGQVRLAVIGEGAARPYLEALARELEVADLVNFAGEVSDADRLRLMGQCRALVVPSLHEELFGMVAVEGALAGLPVIASAIGGLPEIVVPGETGFLIAPGDALALANHIRTLAGDADLARLMGQAGRARALALYTVEAMVDRYEAVYADCIAAACAE